MFGGFKVACINQTSCLLTKYYKRQRIFSFKIGGTRSS